MDAADIVKYALEGKPFEVERAVQSALASRINAEIDNMRNAPEEREYTNLEDEDE